MILWSRREPAYWFLFFFVSCKAIAPEMVALAGEEDSEPVMRTHGGDRRRTEEVEEGEGWGE